MQGQAPQILGIVNLSDKVVRPAPQEASRTNALLICSALTPLLPPLLAHPRPGIDAVARRGIPLP